MSFIANTAAHINGLTEKYVPETVRNFARAEFENVRRDKLGFAIFTSPIPLLLALHLVAYGELAVEGSLVANGARKLDPLITSDAYQWGRQNAWLTRAFVPSSN